MTWGYVLSSKQTYQSVIFKPLSYCFEETIGFDVKASFTSRPVSRLISWYNNQVIQQKKFDKRLFSSMGLFMDWKLQTVILLPKLSSVNSILFMTKFLKNL